LLRWKDRNAMDGKKKVRVELRKNRTKPPRDNSWTQGFTEHGFEEEGTIAGERVRPKGDLSRHRTVTEGADQTENQGLLFGRVVRVHGLFNVVQTEDGQEYRCSLRRVLKSMVIDERSVVTCGDHVWFRTDGQGEGMIEKVEPRHGVLTRESRRREHVLVANVDQVLIVMSLVAPDLKPHLIDRYLASAAMGGLKPLIALNKVDLAEVAPLQALVGAYAQLGIPAIPTSVRDGTGIERLRKYLNGKSTVFSGQSGVGKSSLLNAIQPGLALRVSHVSDVNNKGRHTTTTAELIRLETGGYVVDTPGIRQLQLWDIAAETVEGFFPEFHPFVPLCGFPDCSHSGEAKCAVERGVTHGAISPRRYHSYVGMVQEARQKRR
jgi:ribosome biogenesis GTPase / thiamine phosphate phosphatase